jgi:SpoIIAA-like
VLAPALEAASAGPGKIRILLDFSGEFDGMAAGAVWQDLRMGVRNWNAWERIALVTDHEWMRDGLNMFLWAVPGEARAVPTKDRGAAMRWLVDRS